jgi:hypothetical protein
MKLVSMSLTTKLFLAALPLCHRARVVKFLAIPKPMQRSDYKER